MTGEPVLELWRIEQDRWYWRLEDEAEKSKPTQSAVEIVKAHAGQ
jgi:hypothetical protein